jgi:tetratricopeptide (TPR) repeat protein
MVTSNPYNTPGLPANVTGNCDEPLMNLFISYDADDDRIVTRIEQGLLAAGINTWVEGHVPIVAHEELAPVHDHALETCDAGLMILSAASARSSYCASEWQQLLEQGKLLYLAVIEPLPIERFPVPLSPLRYVDLTQNFNAGLQELSRAIEGKHPLSVQGKETRQVRNISGDFPRWQIDVPLTGRNNDLEQVCAALQSGPIALIQGERGIGATRLAAEIAITGAFKAGVVWHTFVPGSKIQDLAALLREHLHLPPELEDEKVFHEAGQQPLLIVLDSCQLCADPGPYLDIVNRLNMTNPCRVLMVCREPWSELGAAVNCELQPLDPESGLAVLQALLTQRSPSYSLAGYEDLLAQACQYHPRLMQMSLHWADSFPAEKVLAGLRLLNASDVQGMLDALVRRTIGQIVRDGGPEVMISLRRFAICRGGFTLQAALGMMGDHSTPNSIALLEEMGIQGDEDRAFSLGLLKRWGLVRLALGRYEVDPLIVKHISYSDESLADSQQSHYAYYLALADAHDSAMDYEGLAAELPNLETAFEWALASGSVGSAFWLVNSCADFLTHQGRHSLRMSWLERVAAAVADNPDKDLQEALHVDLGLAYAESLSGSRGNNLRTALEHYRLSFQYYTPDDAPLRYAATYNMVGLAFRELSQFENRVKNLRLAIGAYQEALHFYTPEAAPLRYAVTMNILGSACVELSEFEDTAPNLSRAVSAYRKALEYCGPASAPVDYAMIQNNLGDAYRKQAIYGDQVANLQRAVEAFQASLRFWEPRNAPLAYAATQNNLGNAYRELAELKDREENLKQALGAYEQALQYTVPQDTPLTYAHTKANLGLTYKQRGDLVGAISSWQEAEAYYRQAGARGNARHILKWIKEANTH